VTTILPPATEASAVGHTLVRDRESPNVVSERLGHASVTVTLSIYSHVLPGDQKAAAARFAALVRSAE
jgi:integrase